MMLADEIQHTNYSNRNCTKGSNAIGSAVSWVRIAMGFGVGVMVVIVIAHADSWSW